MTQGTSLQDLGMQHEEPNTHHWVISTPPTMNKMKPKKADIYIQVNMKKVLSDMIKDGIRLDER